jgi:hypothetical protein
MDYSNYPEKTRDYVKEQTPVLFGIVILIVILLLLKEIYTLTVFLQNYKYNFDYGKMLRDVCNGSYAEYETPRFQVLDNITKIKIQSGNLHHIVALITSICVCVFFMLLLWGYYIVVVTEKHPFKSITAVWSEIKDKQLPEDTNKSNIILQTILICVSLYLPLIIIIYLSLKLTGQKDISPFQKDANSIGTNIWIIPFMLIIFGIQAHRNKAWSLFFTGATYLVLFVLSAYVMTLVCDIYERKSTSNFYKIAEKFEKEDADDEKGVNIMYKYFNDTLGFKPIKTAEAYYKVYNDIVSVVLIITFIFLGFCVITALLGKLAPSVLTGLNLTKDFSTHLYYICLIPFAVLYIVLVLITINMEYNTIVNKYILYKPATTYRQMIDKINKIFNEMLENDKTNISNNSVCKNVANAIHLAIYQDIFNYKSGYQTFDATNNDLDKYKNILNDASKVDAKQKTNVNNTEIAAFVADRPNKLSSSLLFVPRFTYSSICDTSEYIEYNKLEEYNIDAYMNATKNIFFDNTKQCDTIKNILVIVVMNNFIPDDKRGASDLFDKNTKEAIIKYAIKNVKNSKRYDDKRALEMSDNYENNNSLNNEFKVPSGADTNITDDKHLTETVIPKVVDIYDRYLNTMLLETRRTVKSICECTDTEDITNTGDFKVGMPEKIMNNNTTYTNNLKKNFVTVFIKHTHDMFTDINNVLTSTLEFNQNNQKLAQLLIKNYNAIYEDKAYKIRELPTKTVRPSADNPMENAYLHIEGAEVRGDRKPTADELRGISQNFENEYKMMYYKDNNYYNQLLYDYKQDYIKNLIVVAGDDKKMEAEKTAYETKYYNLTEFSKKLDDKTNIKKEDKLDVSEEHSKQISAMAHTTSHTIWIMLLLYVIITGFAFAVIRK